MRFRGSMIQGVLCLVLESAEGDCWILVAARARHWYSISVCIIVFSDDKLVINDFIKTTSCQ